MNRKDHEDDKPVGRRKGKANNLPGARTKNKKAWQCPLGLMAVLLGNEFDTERAGGTERLVSRPDKAKLGCRMRARYEHVCRLLPELNAHVLSFEFISSPAKLLDGRVYHLYREHKKSGGYRAVVSPEHPMRSKKRRPFWPLARRIYRENLPWSKAQVEAAMKEILINEGTGDRP